MSPVLDRSRIFTPQATLTLRAWEETTPPRSSPRPPRASCADATCPEGKGDIVASQRRGIFHQRSWVLCHCELSATEVATTAEAGALPFAASTALLLEEQNRLALPVRLR